MQMRRYAEPSPKADLEPEPMMHGLAEQAPVHGHCKGGREEDHGVLRAASIDAIDLAIGWSINVRIDPSL